MKYRIYKHSTLTIFGTLNGKAALYECQCREVVFQGFSDKLCNRALELGFAPAVPVWAKPEENNG